MQTLLLSAPLQPPPMRQRAPCTEQRWGLGARHTKCCCPAAHTNQRAICITGAMLMSRSASPPGARRAQKDPPRAPWLFGKLFVVFFFLSRLRRFLRRGFPFVLQFFLLSIQSVFTASHCISSCSSAGMQGGIFVQGTVSPSPFPALRSSPRASLLYELLQPDSFLFAYIYIYSDCF